MTPVETTQEIFGRFGAGDVDGILELLDPEITIDFYGPEIIPYAGQYRGLEEARRFFETVLKSVEIHVFEPEFMFGEDERVAVKGHLRLESKATGREIQSDFAHIIEVRDGRWLHFFDFMNTAVAADAFG